MAEHYEPKTEIWKRSEWADTVLTMLAEDSPYDERLKILFDDLFAFELEDALNYEVLSHDGVLKIREFRKLGIPDEDDERILMSMSETEKIYLEKIVLLYMMHSLHNRRLMRCGKIYYDFEQHDTFLSGCIIHSCRLYNEEICTQLLSHFQSHDERHFLDMDGLKAELGDFVYSIAARSTLIFMTGKEREKQIIIPPRNKSEPLFCFIAEAERFDDDAINDYESYVKYLCRKERNHIADFDSVPTLWLQAVGTPRAGSILNVRPSDRDLQRFVIALALSPEVYHRLIHLRDINPAFQNHAKNTRTRSRGAKDIARERMIEEFMRNSDIRLHVIPDSELMNNPERIPRMMLVRATVDLVRNGFSGLVSLSDKEIDSLNLSENEKAEFLKRYAQSGTRRIKEK